MRKCARCSTPLNPDSPRGRCGDETCPFSYHIQACQAGWSGHPERDPFPDDDTRPPMCTCPKAGRNPPVGARTRHMPTYPADLQRALREAEKATRKIWPSRWPKDKPLPTDTLYADEQLAIHRDAYRKHQLARKLARKYGFPELAREHYDAMRNHGTYAKHGMEGTSAPIRPIAREGQQKYLADLLDLAGQYASVEYDVLLHTADHPTGVEAKLQNEGADPDPAYVVEYAGVFDNHHMVRLTFWDEFHKKTYVTTVQAVPAAVFAVMYAS